MTPPPMHILFAVTEDWYFWSHRRPLAERLARQGCSVSLATRFNRHRAACETAGIGCVPLTFERSLRRPLRDVRALVGLGRAVRRLRPTIVHLVALKPILLSVLALRQRDCVFVAAFTGMGYLFTSDDRRARPLKALVIALLRYVLNHVNVWALVQNEADRTLLADYRLGHPSRTALIAGVGVDTDVFTVRPSPPGEQVNVVLPARLLRDKGIDEFVAAARRLRTTHPHVRCVLVGPQDPDNPAAIAAHDVAAWVGEGAIEWWGQREDMPEVYRQAHIVCLPSYREGLPKVLLEAAACGRPLVATDVPGCREVCRDGDTGLCVPARDADALAAAVATLVDEPQRRLAYGAAARTLVEREFSLERIAADTLAFYRRIRDAAP